MLAPLGADTGGSQFLEPDGTFPNHIPNPEAKEAMDAGIAAVKAAGGLRCWLGGQSGCRSSALGQALHPLGPRITL